MDPPSRMPAGAIARAVGAWLHGGRALPVAACAAAVAAFLGALVRSDDPDMFHHLAMGREIVRSGLPATEPFLFPLRGEPFGAPPYWLGSVVIYLSRAALGEAGLSILPAAVAALLAVVLLLDATPRAGRHTPLSLAAAALPIALALATYRYRAVARTEIFSVLLLAWTMWAIRRFEDGRPRALLALPAVALLWTNLHTGVAVGLVPLAVYVAWSAARALFRTLARRPALAAEPWRRIGIAAAVLAASAAASLATPSPVDPLALAFRLVAAVLRVDGGAAAAQDTSIANALSAVAELRGGGTALWTTPTGVLMAVAALSFALRCRTVRVREVATVGLFAVLPFSAVRFAVFFAIVAAPIAARNLGEAAAALPERVRGLRAVAAAALAAAAVASLPLGAQAPHLRFGTGLVRGVFPVRCADYLRSIGFAGPLFNTFHFGGYLEWHGIGPPFQDGRGATRPEDARAAMAGPVHRPLFAALDARYGFEALLVAYPSGDPAANPLAALGLFEPDRSRWALVAFDDACLVYLRRGGRYAAAVERDEFRHVTPAEPVLQVDRGDGRAALAEYRRSVAEAPDCFRCRFFLGEMELAHGSALEAARAVAPTLAAATGSERAALRSVAARAEAALRGRAGGAR